MTEPGPRGGRSEDAERGDRPIGGSWIIRWDTGSDAPRAVLYVSGSAGDSRIHRRSSGSFALLDGHLFENADDRLGSATAGAARLWAAHERLGERTVRKPPLPG